MGFYLRPKAKAKPGRYRCVDCDAVVKKKKQAKETLSWQFWKNNEDLALKIFSTFFDTPEYKIEDGDFYSLFGSLKIDTIDNKFLLKQINKLY